LLLLLLFLLLLQVQADAEGAKAAKAFAQAQCKTLLLLLVLLLLQVQANAEGVKAVKSVITDAVQIWLAWLKAGVSSSATEPAALAAALGEASGMDQQQVRVEFEVSDGLVICWWCCFHLTHHARVVGSATVGSITVNKLTRCARLAA
jgi:hypothetical protein